MPHVKRYQVFVSSTFDDLKEERFEVMHTLLRLDCFPSGMELFPAAGTTQWTHIKRVIDESDFYVVIVAGRYGTCDSRGMGYTEREYHYALDNAKPVVAFLHRHPESLPAHKVEVLLKDRQKLEAFRAQLQTRLCDYFETPMELRMRVLHAIARLKNECTARGWERGDRVESLVYQVESLTKQLAQQTKTPF